MSLPKRPERSAPIPNDPFDSPEITAIKGPYWDMPLGPGLEADPYGSVQTFGSEPSEPTAMLYGPNGFVGVGTGLQLGANGDLEQGGGYIYCTPAYPELPVTYPPYECQTEVNTTGVTDFTNAWQGCVYLTEFPCVDTSSGVNFSYSWQSCYDLETFPLLNTSNGEVFDCAWDNCQSLSFLPALDLRMGSSFYYTWYDCSSITEFPAVQFNNGENFYGAWSLTEIEFFPDLKFPKGEDFGEAWCGCPNLTDFPALDLRKGQNFDYAWQVCPSLQTFPLVKFRDANSFRYTWQNCSSLVTFPPNTLDNCPATDFTSAWNGCALSQQSVDNILVSINAAGQSGGIVGIDGGTSSAPGPAGLAAKASLQAKGWTVTTN